MLLRKKTLIPSYDFKTCKRFAYKNINCNSIDYIIIEGLFCLYDSNIRKLLDTSIFIDIPNEIRWNRRLNRDTLERGANVVNLTKYYNKFVKPSYDENILPTNQYADKIINDINKNTFTKIINWLYSKFVLEA